MIYVVNVANKIKKILNMKTDIYLMGWLCGYLPPFSFNLTAELFPLSCSCQYKHAVWLEKEWKKALACVRTTSEKKKVCEVRSVQNAVSGITHYFNSRRLGFY